MFKPSMQYFIKNHLFDNVSFELLSYRRSFYLVKRSEFDYITDSLHGTHTPLINEFSLPNNICIDINMSYSYPWLATWYEYGKCHNRSVCAPTCTWMTEKNGKKCQCHQMSRTRICTQSEPWWSKALWWCIPYLKARDKIWKN